MDADTSETANTVAGIKFDAQSTGSNVSSTALEGSINDDRQETFEGSSGKLNEGNVQKPSISDESSSIAMNRPPKSELQVRNDTTSAINKTINQPSDVPMVTESDSHEIEIKQEGACSLPNTPLPPHAVSKIQVCIPILINVHQVFGFVNYVKLNY